MATSAVPLRERVRQSASSRTQLSELGFDRGSMRPAGQGCPYKAIGQCQYAGDQLQQPAGAPGADDQPPVRYECAMPGCSINMHVLCALDSASPSHSQQDERVKLHCPQHLVSQHAHAHSVAR